VREGRRLSWPRWVVEGQPARHALGGGGFGFLRCPARLGCGGHPCGAAARPRAPRRAVARGLRRDGRSCQGRNAELCKPMRHTGSRARVEVLVDTINNLQRAQAGGVTLEKEKNTSVINDHAKTEAEETQDDTTASQEVTTRRKIGPNVAPTQSRQRTGGRLAPTRPSLSTARRSTASAARMGRAPPWRP